MAPKVLFFLLLLFINIDNKTTDKWNDLPDLLLRHGGFDTTEGKWIKYQIVFGSGVFLRSVLQNEK